MSAHLPGGSLFSVAVIFEVICCGGCCIFPSHKNQIETGFLLSFSRYSSLSLTLPLVYTSTCVFGVRTTTVKLNFVCRVLKACINARTSVHKLAWFYYTLYKITDRLVSFRFSYDVIVLNVLFYFSLRRRCVVLLYFVCRHVLK